MKTRKRLTALLLSLIMLLGAALIGPPAANAAAPSAEDLTARLIAYYRDYQQDAATDIQRTLDEIRKIDETQADAWSDIMDYWNYVNTDMTVNIDVTEDDLPQDDTLAIVVLGYALNWNGTMKQELVDRLKTGLACADKYPDAVVVVTGGGTALLNPCVTEGGQMGQWLLDHGLEEDRLIVEDRASNTVGNADNTFRILAQEQPQVDSVVIVTSDYHVPRGSVLFQSRFILSALNSDRAPLKVVSNAGCETGRAGYESIALQARGMADVADVRLPGRCSLSTLNGLTIEQASASEALTLQVTAQYDTNYTRNVSALAEVTGYDPGFGNQQTVMVSYTENGVTMSTHFDLQDRDKVIRDDTRLKELVSEVGEMDTALYTDASEAQLRKALERAQNLVLLGMEADAREVDEAYTNLKAAADQLVELENFAHGAKVTANCNQGSAWKVTDGTRNLLNYWASRKNGNVASKDASLIIDLGGVRQVEHIQVFPYWGGKRVYKYELLGSLDGETWFELDENLSDNYVTSEGIGHDVQTEAAYIKLQGIETRVKGRRDINNLHIVELEVYGCPSAEK